MITGVWSICNSSYGSEKCVYNYITIVVITMVNRTTLHPYSFSKYILFWNKYTNSGHEVFQCSAFRVWRCSPLVMSWWSWGKFRTRAEARGGFFFAARRWAVRQGRCFNHQLILWLFNISMEHGAFIDDFPIKPPFIRDFPCLYGYVK